MIKMYVMQTCPDCEYVEKQVEGKPSILQIFSKACLYWSGSKIRRL